MSEKIFKFGLIELPAFEQYDGEWLFEATLVVTTSELVKNSNHVVRWLDTNLPPKWIVELKIPGKLGRPAIYITEAGLYYCVCQAKTDLGRKFRNYVFEEVLPSTRKKGYFVDSEATASQLSSLYYEIEQLRRDKEILTGYKIEKESLIDVDGTPLLHLNYLKDENKRLKKQVEAFENKPKVEVPKDVESMRKTVLALLEALPHSRAKTVIHTYFTSF